MNKVNKIFVYGTLMNGFLKSVFPGVDLHISNRKGGKITARLFDLGEYPGAKRTSIFSKAVTGEVYEIDPEYLEGVLLLLDEYEGYDPAKKQDSLYVRSITTVTTDDGSFSRAWVYWYNRPVSGKNEIDKGDYTKYLKRNK